MDLELCKKSWEKAGLKVCELESTDTASIYVTFNINAFYKTTLGSVPMYHVFGADGKKICSCSDFRAALKTYGNAEKEKQ